MTIAGAVQPVPTVIVARALSSESQLFVTRTQELVVVLSAGVVKFGLFVPTGCDVSPTAFARNH